MDRRPFGQRDGFVLGALLVVNVEGEAGRDFQCQECPVPKIQAQAVIFAAGVELYFLDDLALNDREPDKASVREVLLLESKFARIRAVGLLLAVVLLCFRFYQVLMANCFFWTVVVCF